MPRKTTFNDPSRQVVQTVEDQHKYDTPTFRRLQVNAQPTNYYVTPAYTDQANTLAAALVEASPTLAIMQQGAFKNFHEEKFVEGQAARLAEGNIDPKDSKELGFFTTNSFQRGYMSLAGFQSGQQAAEELQAAWDTDPERNSMPTQDWIANWMKKNAPASTDGAFLEGFNKQVIPVANNLIGQGVKDKLAGVRAAVNEKVTGIVTNGINQGWNADVANQIKTELQGDGTPDKPGIVGMSNGDWDKTFIDQVSAYINSGGDPEKARQALKWTKEKRPDGTPGIYYKPGMAKVVDDLMDQAYSVTIQKNNLEENMDRIGRSGDQKKHIDTILTTALDKGVASGFSALNKAVKENPELWSPGLRMTVMEKLRRIQTLSKSVDGEGDGNSPAFAKLISQAITGDLTTEQIADMVGRGQIKVGQAGQLMSYTTRANSMDKAQFKTPAYNQGLMTLQALPERPPATVPDVDGTIGRNMALRKAYAIANYNDEVAKNPNADPTTLADNIHKSETKYFNEGRYTNDPYFKMYVPKYPSRQAFIQALESNAVKPGVDVKKESQHWNWLQSQSKGN